MGVHKALDVPPNFREGGCTEPETVGNFHHGGAQSLRCPAILVNGMHKKRAGPEAVGNFHHGAAQSLRRPAIFLRGCTAPETVGKLHHGGAESLRRPKNFVNGMHKKC